MFRCLLYHGLDDTLDGRRKFISIATAKPWVPSHLGGIRNATISYIIRPKVCVQQTVTPIYACGTFCSIDINMESVSFAIL